MSIQMVVTDLDRTLLKSDGTISSFTLSIINEIREQGIWFTIATARPEDAVKNLLPELRFDYAVYHNGALVDYGGRYLTTME